MRQAYFWVVGPELPVPLANAPDLLTLRTDRLQTLDVLPVLGVLIGSTASARLRREFKLEGFVSPRECDEHALGAAMMGSGGITALGCSIGSGVTDLARLSSGSILAVAGISGAGRFALQGARGRVLRPAAA